MKHFLTLAVIAAMASLLPSCETYVNAHGQTRTSGHSHHHRSSSGTNVNANVGASLGL